MRIVFFGSPQFAVPTLAHLIASGHPVAGVVTQPDRPRGRGHRVSEGPVKALALAHHLPVLQPDRLRDAAFQESLAHLAPDLGVVAAYGKILPEGVLAIPRLGMINVHASLLPRWRGAAPVHRAIIAGDRETGVTIMRVVRELDAGPMFDACRRPIGPHDTADRVEADLSEMGAELLVRVVDAIAAGQTTETPQDVRLVTYAPRLTKEEGLIDWALPAKAIHDKVRGLYPWPHACTFLGNARFIILRTLPEQSGPTGTPPGVVVEAHADRLAVATGGGLIRIEEIQAEGGRPMHVRQFLAGHRIEPGSRFLAQPLT